MDNIRTPLSANAEKQLEEVKGLKRLDKLFALNPDNVSGIHAQVNSANALIALCKDAQDGQVELAIVHVESEDNEFLPPGFFESLKDFRRQVFIPVIIETTEEAIDTYGVEKFIQQIAAVALDGFTIEDINADTYQSKYFSSIDKYGLSYVFQISNANDKIKLEDVDKVASAFIYLSSVLVSETITQFKKLKNPILAGMHENEIVPVPEFLNGRIIKFSNHNPEQLKSALNHIVKTGRA